MPTTGLGRWRLNVEGGSPTFRRRNGRIGASTAREYGLAQAVSTRDQLERVETGSNQHLPRAIALRCVRSRVICDGNSCGASRKVFTRAPAAGLNAATLLALARLANDRRRTRSCCYFRKSATGLQARPRRRRYAAAVWRTAQRCSSLDGAHALHTCRQRRASRIHD